jgi:predicted dehydrogenase
MSETQPNQRSDSNENQMSRRKFVATTAAASAMAIATGCATPGRRENAAIPPGKYDKIRVGLIGCGGRGTGAAINCVESSDGVTIAAMGDLFQDRLDGSKNTLKEKIGDKLTATGATCFVGFDAFQKVIASPIDMVILATPPHFRPQQLRAALEADKHVFMEKPVGVDPVGIRSVIDSAAIADQKGLAVVAGTQRRHQASYLGAMQRIQDGMIGDVVAAQCFWNQGGLWVKKREPGWSDMEWQVRNWLYFTWLSGDHIVEQHVHNIDVVNWAIGAHPIKAVGMGGRQVRVQPEYGNIFDHFAIEYEYPNGQRVLSMCRQIDGSSHRVGEHILGSKGWSNPNGHVVSGKKEWKYDDGGKPINPYVQEHADLIASIRAGKPLNEAKRIAESTLTAIMGRMSAYTGREISWDWVMKSSELDLSPRQYVFGDLPYDPVAVPGETKLI